MNTTTIESPLKSALVAFETSVAKPIVSGELHDWLAGVDKSWNECEAQLDYETRHEHPPQFEQIGSQDPELLPRVEQLQAEDAAIEVDREKLAQCVRRMMEHIPKLEPDEDKAQQHLKKLVDEAMAFVARVRKQDVAVETWFVEAFNRDRGTAD